MAEARRARTACVGCGARPTSYLYPQIPVVPGIDLRAVCDTVRESAHRRGVVRIGPRTGAGAG